VKVTLRTKNTAFISGFLVINYLGFAYVNGLPHGFFDKIKITKTGLEFDNPLITIGLYLLVLLLCSIFPASLKHSIVFLRWKNPLPGSRAFTEWCYRDERVSKEELVKRYGELPTDPGEQNRLWYKIYKEKQNETVVYSSHGLCVVAPT
jgi:hypothetical protein